MQPGLDTLSARRQCDLLQVARSGLYYQPVEVCAEELRLMRRIDELYLVRPFYGSRHMTVALHHEGHEVNGKRVQRLMRLILPAPRLALVKPDQVWAADITVRATGVRVGVPGGPHGLVQPSGAGLARDSTGLHSFSQLTSPWARSGASAGFGAAPA